MPMESAYTADEAIAILERADCSAQKVYSLEENLTDPQAWANNYLYHGKDSRTGADRIYPAMPVDVGDNAPVEYVRGPKLGEDSVAVLKRRRRHPSQPHSVATASAAP